LHFLVNSIPDSPCQVKLVSGTCDVLSWLSLAVAWLTVVVSSLALVVALADVLVKALRLWVDARRKQEATGDGKEGASDQDARAGQGC